MQADSAESDNLGKNKSSLVSGYYKGTKLVTDIIKQRSCTCKS